MKRLSRIQVKFVSTPSGLERKVYFYRYWPLGWAPDFLSSTFRPTPASWERLWRHIKVETTMPGVEILPDGYLFEVYYTGVAETDDPPMATEARNETPDS